MKTETRNRWMFNRMQIFTVLPLLALTVRGLCSTPPASHPQAVDKAAGIVSTFTNLPAALYSKPAPVIRVHGQGATASGIPGGFKVDFDGNLNHAAAITLVLPDQQLLRGHVVALAVSDATGRREWLGQLQDCQGAVREGNQVIYTDAFEGIRADVVCSFRLTAYEQDVVIRENILLPASLDAASAELQVWSEFFAPPTPKRHPKRLPHPAGKAVGLTPDAEPADEELDFGTMRIVEGRAFKLTEEAVEVQTLAATAKRWVETEGRTFLVESVPFGVLQAALATLPAPDRRKGSRLARTTAGPSCPPVCQTRNHATPVWAKPAVPDLIGRRAGAFLAGVVLDYRIVTSGLLNVKFGKGTRVGPAAVGQANETADDYWNIYAARAVSGTLTPLVWADGKPASGSWLTIVNAPNLGANTTRDSLMDTYLYPANGGNLTVTLHALPAGQYDFYIYGVCGNLNQTNGVYALTSAVQDYGLRSTRLQAGWETLAWTEGEHYVMYPDVLVAAGQPVVITAMPGGTVALINGLQAVARDEAPPLSYAEVAKTQMTAEASSTGWGWVPANAINGSLLDPGWHNAALGEDPAWLRLDLGTSYRVGRIEYCPRQGAYNGTFEQYSIYVTDSPSKNPADWGEAVASGTWYWSGYAVTRALAFSPKQGRYVGLRCRRGFGGYASVNEAWVYRALTPTDADGDGLPDAWELAYFGDLHSGWSDDPDADGIPNGQEHLQGRHPLQGSLADIHNRIGLQVYAP